MEDVLSTAWTLPGTYLVSFPGDTSVWDGMGRRLGIGLTVFECVVTPAKEATTKYSIVVLFAFAVLLTAKYSMYSCVTDCDVFIIVVHVSLD